MCRDFLDGLAGVDLPEIDHRCSPHARDGTGRVMHINAAWKAAMQARMAKNCEMMEENEGEVETEAERQYRIAGENL